MTDVFTRDGRAELSRGPRPGAFLLACRICRFVAHRERCLRDARRLARLPDYLLEDIGLERGDLPSPWRLW